MRYIKQFTELSKNDASAAGGKGASLGEMTRLFGGQAHASNPVPPGFVLLANAFDVFLAETDIGVEIAAVLDTVKTDTMHTVEHGSEKIQKLILSASMPSEIANDLMHAHAQLGAELVAVRSSATAEDSASAAWAGQLDSYLNTTRDTLLQNVQKCWASLFTPRAIFYGFEKGFHTSGQWKVDSEQKKKNLGISVAVVVQTMVQSEVSGIAFSVHPVTQDKNQLIIEAGYGLGEAIVSGQITPDSYVVTKDPFEIIDKNISTQDRMLVRSVNGGNEWIEINHRCTDSADRPPVIPVSTSPRGKTGIHLNAQSTGSPGLEDSPEDDRTGSAQKLSDTQILDLSRLVIKIENHYGFPCDIEWAWANGQFYITQSRPITTLNPIRDDRLPSLNIQAADYVCTFKASGVSILYADMVNTMYLPYDPLIYIYQGKYYQYLRAEQFSRAGEDGARLFSDKNLYAAYVKELEDVVASFEAFCTRHRQSHSQLEKGVIQKFIDYSEKFHRLYSRMGFEHTDKAFLLQETNEIVHDNLKHLSVFKDQIRTKLNKIYFEEGSFFSFILAELASLFGVGSKALESYTQNELVALFDGQTISEHELNARYAGFAIQSIERATRYVTGPAVVSIYESLEMGVDLQTTSLQGVVANKGLAKGAVRKISLDYSDFEKLAKAMEKMGKGQILVAETTAPELMGAIRKAAAIITDQGGLMSHAAIVSRELSIPCIVGTKIATQVLHDGDLVEVDANTGVVRVLEKAK